MARFNLPDIDFVEVDTEEIESIAVGKFEELQGVSLSESDPRRKFIQSIAYVAAMLANNIDYTGKQNLLAYATDNYLDHLGIRKNVPRLEPEAAETIIRFEVNAPETFVIPAGTRLSVNEINFALTEDTTVSPGTSTVDIKATCEEVGTIGNGYLPGQITNIVDPDYLPWVSKAYNITKSEGGYDWEDDESYAERIRQSNSQYSSAGPEDAYVFHTKSANPLIEDVQVDSPSPGVVLIIPLLKNGQLADEEITKQIYEKLNTRTIRPITDKVVVQNPDIVNYEIDLTYYIPKEKETLLTSIKDSVNKAVEEYQVWQKGKLGRGIDPSELVSRVKATGAVRVFADSPVSYQVLSKTQVAIANKVTINYGGIVDD